jgi:hypothetical protein
VEIIAEDGRINNRIQDGKIPFIGEVINMDEDKIMME